MVKKHFLIGFFLCLLLLSAITVLSVTAYESSDTQDVEEVNPQQAACDAHQLLLSTFEEAEYGFIYPDEYGGDYIEDNILHICLTEYNSDIISRYKEILGDVEYVVYEAADYSLNELIYSKDDAMEYLMDNGIEVYLAAISERDNNISIEVSENNLIQASQLMNSYNTEQVSALACTEQTDLFTLTSGSPNETAAGSYVVGGSRLYSSGYFRRTLAATGTVNSQVMFLTCGHSTSSYQQFTSSSGTYYGMAVYIRYTNGGYGDFSFLAADNSFTTTQRVWTTAGNYTTLSGTLDIPAVGTNIYRYGAISGQSIVTVTNTNVTINTTQSDGSVISIKGLCRATGDADSIPGDSGGPYRQGSYFCGVHHGHSTNDASTVYFTPYYYIRQANFSF